jgi:hypothetical protein
MRLQISTKSMTHFSQFLKIPPSSNVAFVLLKLKVDQIYGQVPTNVDYAKNSANLMHPQKVLLIFSVKNFQFNKHKFPDHLISSK